jgi:predicted AAA+ superfamily ATPase
MIRPLGRTLAEEIRRALARFPAVLLAGARQTGKSTLVRAAGGDARGYFTFDDLSVLSAARRDPSGFVQALEGPATLDEVQRVPDLLLAVKNAIERDRTPGRFLLTGSATLLPFDRAGETLAGRAAVLRLRPLTESELAGKPEWNPVDVLLGARGPGGVVAAEERRGPPCGGAHESILRIVTHLLTNRWDRKKAPVPFSQRAHLLTGL